MRLIQWSVIVAVAAAGGSLFGWCVGIVLSYLSADYVAIASDYATLGLRVGVLAGTIMAASHFIGPKHAIATSSAIRSLVMAGAIATAMLCLAGVVGGSLSFLPLIPLTDANLAHPRRYVIFLVLHHAWPYALVLGALLASYRLWRRRSV